MPAPENIRAAVVLLNKRLLPAKLHQTEDKNSDLLLTWARAAKFNAATPANEIVNLWEKKIKDTLFQRELIWEVEPKALQTAPRNTTGVQVEGHQSLKEVNKTRAEQMQAQEANAAEIKAQEAAAQSVNNLIDSFNPPHRRSGIDYATKEAVQKQLRAHVEKEKQRGVKMTDVLPVLQAFIAKKYSEIERQIERM